MKKCFIISPIGEEGSEIRKNADTLNKSESERYEFWTLFNERVIARGKPFVVHKPTIKHYNNIAVGKSGVGIAVTLVQKDNCVGVELYISDDKELFDKLESLKAEIENKLGFNMDWQRLENAKASRMIYKISGLNFDDHSNYDKLIDEAINKVIAMKKVFKDYLK